MLFNADDFLKVMKKAAFEAIEAHQPSDYRFGTVLSVSPLKIQVEQKMTLTAAQLVLTRNVTDFEINITVHNWSTENKSGGGGDSAFASHNHQLNGMKRITVHNALVVGDKVVLIKKKGGQQYLVLDRVVNV